ncbi:MAG TPA: EamA family transporter [Candidatus Limnocylindrales bacterium]
MAPIVFVLVAGAALLHVTWNVLLKTAGDPLRAAAVGMSAAAIVLCPTAFVAWLLIGRPAVPGGVVVLSVVSGLLEAAYFAFLAAAYRRGDLSVVYPIARGSAPLLAVAIGVLILGERLDPTGFLGVASLLGGILALQRPWQYLRAAGREDSGAAGYALLTGVMIAGYSAVDSVAVKQTQPWIYAGLIWVSCVVFLWSYVWTRAALARRAATLVAETGGGPAVALAVGDPGEEIDPAPTRFSNRRAAVGGLITLAAYLLILFAYSVAPLTAVAPLRESAIVIASGWGALRMREAVDRRDAIRRIAAAALVLVGALLLALE